MESMARDRHHSGNGRGFSLIELMIVVGVVVALALIIVPATQRARAQYHLITAADQIISNLELARSEAVKRDSTATVTFNASGAYTIQYSNGAANVTIPQQLPGGVSFALPGGAAAVSVRYSSSGKVTVTPAGAGVVVQGAYGQKTLTVGVAGNISRS
jgi:type IV fimbrial biogenesis protein FimT